MPNKVVVITSLANGRRGEKEREKKSDGAAHALSPRDVWNECQHLRCPGASKNYRRPTTTTCTHADPTSSFSTPPLHSHLFSSSSSSSSRRNATPPHIILLRHHPANNTLSYLHLFLIPPPHLLVHIALRVVAMLSLIWNSKIFSAYNPRWRLYLLLGFSEGVRVNGGGVYQVKRRKEKKNRGQTSGLFLYVSATEHVCVCVYYSGCFRSELVCGTVCDIAPLSFALHQHERERTWS